MGVLRAKARTTESPGSDVGNATRAVSVRPSSMASCWRAVMASLRAASSCDSISPARTLACSWSALVTSPWRTMLSTCFTADSAARLAWVSMATFSSASTAP